MLSRDELNVGLLELFGAPIRAQLLGQGGLSGPRLVGFTADLEALIARYREGRTKGEDLTLTREERALVEHCLGEDHEVRGC